MIVKSLESLKKHIKDNKLGNFVFIHGNEKDNILKSENIIKSIVNNFIELNVIELEGNNITFDQIQNACETLPVMADIKVVHIKSPTFVLDNLDSISKSILKEVIDYSKDIPEYTILIISHSDVVDKTNNLIKIASNIGTLVELKIPAYGKDLTLWIETFIKEKGKTISKSDAYYLSNEVISSIENIEIELEKLISYVGSSECITKKDIDNIIYKTLENNIFKMTDCMYKKDGRGALEILDAIFLQGEQYPRIMFMIVRQFRILYSVKLLIEEGVSSKDIISTLKLQEFVYKSIIKIISKWDSCDIKAVLEDGLSTDYDIKSGKIPPELGLELFILRTCK